MAVHLAKGARDFLPDAMRRRLALMETIREVFERFGFEPLGTPAFERIETLTGKYGDEGEKLLFKILKRGRGEASGEADMALRYDLTVPLARVVAMNPALRMPFKRWQMAPVWRADRPQRGRFREFWQCDVDIVGTTSPLADAECVAVASAALTALDFPNHLVRLNDRRVLRAMARAAGASGDREIPLLIIVDKLDKVGRDGVTEELRGLGIDDDGLARLWSILDVPSGHAETLDALRPHLDEEGRAGLDTLAEVLSLAQAMGVAPERLTIDPTLARGLDYYTGPVYEIVLPDTPIGSVSGGGRYDGLVGMFSKKPVPAVGVSLGIERLLTVLEEREAAATGATAQVLVTCHDAAHRDYALQVATTLRAGGVRTELYLDDRKIKAQLKHANARGYAWVAFCGPDERSSGSVRLKHLESGAQHDMTLQDAVDRLLQ